MTKQQIEEYAAKYKKNQKVLTIIVSVFILLLGILFLGVGIFLCLNAKIIVKVVGIVMITAGLLDFSLGVKFIKFSYENLKYMQNRDAATRYCKIHGINQN